MTHWIRDLRDIRFFQQQKLRVACDPPREAVGQAECRGERQHRDGVRAANACGERRNGGAQHVHPRVAPRHRPPRGLGRDEGRLRRQAAGLLDPRPKEPQRAELGDGEKLIGIGREAKFDHAPRRIERDAAGTPAGSVADASGYLYYVAVAGVTGTKQAPEAEIAGETTDGALSALLAGVEVPRS